METKCWLWPDHAIGKRESRQLREEHNSVVNINADLLAACKRAIVALEQTRRYAVDRPVMNTPIVTVIQRAGTAIVAMQEAIARAEGRHA
jgi:hypothetical protein